MSCRALLLGMLTLAALATIVTSCDDDDQASPAPSCDVTLEVPNVGGTWKVGETYLIRWSSSGPCGSIVSLELLREGEVCLVLADSTADDGGLFWECTACADDTSGYRVRVTDIVTGRADHSDMPFTLSPHQGLLIHWTDESAPGPMVAGSTTDLHWDNTGLAGDSVMIELLCDGSVCDTLAAAEPNDGSFTWEVAAGPSPETDLSFRVTDLMTGASDVTDWTFRVVTGEAFAVTQPNGGETWLTGQTHEITWEPAGGAQDSVAIELLHDGVACHTISSGAPGGGTFLWTVTGCWGDSCAYAVRVTSLATGLADASDEDFCILSAELDLSAPNGGETWYEGETRTITWDASGAVGDTLQVFLARQEAICDTITLEAATAAGGLDWTVASCACGSAPCDSCAYTVRLVNPSTGITDESAATFCILPPALTVTAPNGGEVWNEGEPQTITWEPSGAAGDAVRIELLLEGVVCATLADSTDNTGAFAWTAAPCGADTSGYTIRVTDLETGAQDQSDDAFRIAPPTLTITSPNGGEDWIEGGNYVITWGRSGLAGDSVTIELLHEGAVCATIAAEAPNNRSYTWTAAPCAGDSCAYRVRITDPTTGVADTSDAVFCVRSYVFAVLSPADGDRWFEGAEQEISWTRAGTSGEFVKIELLHEGAVCATIAESAPNTRTFLWSTAPCEDDTCGFQIRVTDTTTQSTDDSEGAFCVPPSTLTVTAPVGGDAWTEGTMQQITWTQEGLAGESVLIELLHEGAPCDTIATEAPNIGGYAWTVAACEADTCGYQIRVTDAAAGTSGQSAGELCITRPQLFLTMPNGGEAWEEGTAYTILWQVVGTAGDAVVIELLHDGAVCDTIAADAPNIGAYAWVARGCQAEADGYQVRITDPATGTSDTSAATFSIAPTLLITAPNGGQQWREGSTQTIIWDHSHTYGDSVQILLLHDGAVCDTITAATANDGDFDWAVAGCGSDSCDYRVRVIDPTTGAQDESDAGFCILPPTVTVLDPDGGEQWLEGTAYTITWSSEGTAGDSVRIELLHEGTAVDTLIDATVNDGSFGWTPAEHEGNTCCYQVRITDLTTGAHDDSDSSFSILRDFRLTAPNGGESWYRNGSYAITWVKTASAGDSALIELLCDGTICDTIASAVANDGSHDWTVSVPEVDSCGFKVQITDLTTGDQDASNGSFCVETPVLTLVSPNGGEVWDVGSEVDITWSTSAGISDSVMIELLADGAACDTIAAAAPNDTSYPWTVSACAGVDSCGYSIRIRDLSIGVVDTSDARFCILPGSVALTSPAGGEEWVAGATYTIGWTHTETAGANVRLLLLRDSAVRDTIAASTANDDSLRWTAERFGGVSIGYWISITDLTTGDVDSTDGAIWIGPGPELTSPNGGEAWVAGDERDVTWTDPAPAEHSIRLELLQDGVLCDTLTNGTDNDGAFTWTVTRCGTDTSGYAIRLTNTNTGAVDTCDARFSIYTDPTVTYPNGGETLTAGSAYDITWLAATGAGGENVRIELMRAGATCDVVIASTANDGEYNWTFAQCGGESSNYKILITNLTSTDADSSDAAFTIE